MIQFDEHIFQPGWNHQLVNLEKFLGQKFAASVGLQETMTLWKFDI